MSSLARASSQWIYRGLWKVLTDLFRVPRDPPDLPVRPGESIARFQPSDGYLRYLKIQFWIFLLITDIAFTAGYLAAAAALCMAGVWWISLALLPVALFIIVAPDILAYIAIHLRYDTTWYVMTDRSLRIRRGVWSIHETTITFENVQNVKVQQGPLQRYYGIANLIVETAGAGTAAGKHGSSMVGNQGIIEGVDNASELRDRILARLRQSKSAGLGDEAHDRRILPSAAATTKPGWSVAHIAALREIRDEVRALARA